MATRRPRSACRSTVTCPRSAVDSGLQASAQIGAATTKHSKTYKQRSRAAGAGRARRFVLRACWRTLTWDVHAEEPRHCRPTKVTKGVVAAPPRPGVRLHMQIAEGTVLQITSSQARRRTQLAVQTVKV